MKLRDYRKRVLVIRLSAFGDVAILSPVIRLRAEANPDTLFLVAAPDRLMPLFCGIPNLRFVPTLKKQSPFALYKQFKSLRPTVVADMHHVNRVIVADFLLQLRGLQVVSIDKKSQPPRPSWLRYNEVFDRCGLKSSKELIIPYHGRYDETIAGSYFELPQNDTGVYRIGIAPFTQHEGKMWPLEKMEQLVHKLSEDERFQIVLFGSLSEEDTLNAWTNKYPRVTSMAGTESFDIEMNMLADLDVMVSMDSANMHFASCFGVPVISIWGATHPQNGFYGWRQNPDWAVQVDMPCRPCSKFGNKTCKFKDYRCMNAITPDMVLKKIYQLTIDKNSR